MNLVRSSVFLSVAVLVGTASVIAQGPPAQPAPTAMTTAKTWTDADLDRLMKEIGPALGVLRKSLDGQNAEAAKEQAEKLEMLFEEVDDFWTARNVKDASEVADNAAEHADHVEDAIDAKDFAKAAENLKMLQSTCASCHGKYRDKGPDGAYRIKP